MDPSMLQTSDGVEGAATLNASVSMGAQSRALVSLGANRAGSMISPACGLVSFPLEGCPTGRDPLNGAFPLFGSQFSPPQDLLKKAEEEIILTKVNNDFSRLQLGESLVIC